MTGAKCGDTWGTAVGAGHVCTCIREAGHEVVPGEYPKVHGCPCGNWWPQKKDQP